MQSQDQLAIRVMALESRERSLRIAFVVLLILLVISMWMPQSRAQQTAGSLRVRGLIVEDENGKDRIVLGAPMGGSSGRSGLRINDENGVERVGLSLLTNGSVVLGLDAPVGTGDDRNRERITLVADASGGAAVRMKDRRTMVVSSWYLDDQNRGWLEFSDFLQQPASRRRIGLSGEEPAGAR